MMDDNNISANESEEYELMLTLEQLESLEEELEEVHFTSLTEVEAALALTTPTSHDERRQVLLEIRDQMLELDVTNLAAIREQIAELNEELDDLG